VAWVSVLIVAALLVLVLGQVHGIEFLPRTFQRRSFTFFQLPLVGWQITPVWQRYQPGQLEAHLTQNGLLSSAPQADRWDVAWVAESGRQQEADPMILTRYLDVVDANGDQRWLKWTTEHPELAKVFWPAVQRLAGLQGYVLLPELFEMAQHATDAAELQRQIDRYLSHALVELAADQTAAGSQRSAVSE
jgi:hypothetical protein